MARGIGPHGPFIAKANPVYRVCRRRGPRQQHYTDKQTAARSRDGASDPSGRMLNARQPFLALRGNLIDEGLSTRCDDEAFGFLNDQRVLVLDL